MLIATGLGAVAFAASLASAAPLTAALPPIVVTVDVAVDLPPLLLSLVQAEADAIWRPTGMTFVWRRAPRATAIAAGTGDPCPELSTGLRVVIGDERGRSPADQVALGWIVFDENDAPAREIYVSHRNVMDFMIGARGAVPPISQMPLAEQNLKLGRAMGRALAHEMGHYFLASKAHARRGLMQATHTASAFFDIDRSSFAIDKAMRQELVARLRPEPLTASAQPGK